MDQKLIDKCLEHIRYAPDTEDASDYVLTAIELAKELESFDDVVEAASGESVEVSRAVVATPPVGWGQVLWYQGPDLECEIEEVGQGLGTDDLGLFNAPPGLSVWEGRFRSEPSDSETGLEAIGSFRDLTDEEWAAVRRGESPWGE